MFRMKLSLELPVTTKEEDGLFISCCEPLDVYSQGNTKKSALDNIQEALSLFIVSCVERGTLEQVLQECGFTPVRSTPGHPPKMFQSPEESWLNIPIPLLQTNPSGCRA